MSIRILLRYILGLTLCTHLCPELCRAADHSPFTIDPPPVLQRPLDNPPAVSADLNAELRNIRSLDLIQVSRQLLDDQRTWYCCGNVFETIGRAARYIAPLVTGIGAGLSNPAIGFWGMGIGLFGAAAADFGRYAHDESKERGMAANQIFRDGGIPPIPLLRSFSDTVSVVAPTGGVPPSPMQE